MTIKPYGRTTPVPLRHRQIDKLNMLDWIRDCAETEKRMPTDGEIMERFGFTHPEQARTLLADLSDAGKITIFGTGEDREILLGRVRPSQRASVERPVPSVVRPEARPANARKAGAERISDILRNVKAKASAPKPVVERLEKAGAKLTPAGKTIAEQLKPIVEAAQDGEPNVVDAKPVKAATIAAVASVATTSPAQPERKPLLRADMTAAAIRNGMPIDGFLRLLLERGFQSFLNDEQKGIAA